MMKSRAIYKYKKLSYFLFVYKLRTLICGWMILTVCENDILLQKYRMHIRKHPLHPAKTLPSSDQPVLLDRETQSLISLTRSDSPQSPLVVDRGCLFSNNGHSSEDEVKSDGRSSWKSVSNKNRPALDLELWRHA